MADPRLAILGALAGLALPVVAAAQDPVALYPDNYKVLAENDRVRVMDFRLRKATPSGCMPTPRTCSTCSSRLPSGLPWATVRSAPAR